MRDKRSSIPLLLVLFCEFISTSTESYFPEDVKICSAKDPLLDKCFQESANKMMYHLSSGIRSLNAVPMDPMLIPEISLAKGNTVFPNLEFTLRDIDIRGWKDGVVTRAKVDPMQRIFEIDMLFPLCHVRGLYDLKGNIANIPLDGNSDFELYLKNITLKTALECNIVSRNGRPYLSIERFQPETFISDATANFNNLFNDTKISLLTNNIMNQNIRQILNEVTPIIDEVFGDVVKQLIARILDQVPYDSYFTEMDDIPLQDILGRHISPLISIISVNRFPPFLYSSQISPLGLDKSLTVPLLS